VRSQGLGCGDYASIRDIPEDELMKRLVMKSNGQLFKSRKQEEIPVEDFMDLLKEF